MGGGDFLPGRAIAAELNAYIELLERSLIRSRLRGDPGNWFELERALDRVSGKVTDGAKVRVPEWAYQLELDIWLEVLIAEVLDEFLVRVVDEIDGMRLRAHGPATSDPGVWAPLALRVTGDGVLHRSRMATEATLLGAYRQYLEKPSAVRMRDAIAALRDLSERSLPSTLSHGVTVLSREGEYLEHALGQVLPSTARLLLATGVRLLFEKAVASVPVRELPESRETDWFRRYPGLDRWYPVWVGVEQQARKEACEDTAPRLFAPETQDLYQEWRDNRERDIKEQDQALTRRARQEPDEQDSLPIKVEDAETHPESVDPVDPDEQTSSNDDMATTPDEVMEVMEPERYVTIHVLVNGFTALGAVLPRGFELTLDRESPGWGPATVDLNGKSWVDESEAQQRRRHGRVRFRRGPWRGPGKRSGVGTLAPDGTLARPVADKKYPIARSHGED